MASPNLASIPPSTTAVEVSIINPSFVGNIPVSVCMKPQVGSHQYLSCPCYSFFIHHAPSNTRLLFDLGIRKDYETGFPPEVWDRLKTTGWDISATTDVAEILSSHDVSLDSINGIIWSHHHWDHTGDPSQFPPSTSLIVGPGFKGAQLPAWPERADALLDQKSLEGREMVELDFSGPSAIKIGAYSAIDYFGDGSFYLLDTPGHTIGHISALARTTLGEDSTFIFMGGDIAHHCGEFRPSPELPLPDTISPDPRTPPYHASATGSFCPGSIFTPLHPCSTMEGHDSKTMPFYLTGGAHDEELAQTTVYQMPKLDGSENVLTMITHDSSLEGIVKFFPETANEWKQKGWRKEGLWRFLADFLGKDS